eukprot:5809143-Pyramimonas_sp.AAC.1
MGPGDHSGVRDRRVPSPTSGLPAALAGKALGDAGCDHRPEGQRDECRGGRRESGPAADSPPCRTQVRRSRPSRRREVRAGRGADRQVLDQRLLHAPGPEPARSAAL